jgi:hypothetical protein
VLPRKERGLAGLYALAWRVLTKSEIAAVEATEILIAVKRSEPARENGRSTAILRRDQFAFSLLCGYQFAVSRSCNTDDRFCAFQAKVADDDVAGALWKAPVGVAPH